MVSLSFTPIHWGQDGVVMLRLGMIMFKDPTPRMGEIFWKWGTIDLSHPFVCSWKPCLGRSWVNLDVQKLANSEMQCRHTERHISTADRACTCGSLSLSRCVWGYWVLSIVFHNSIIAGEQVPLCKEAYSRSQKASLRDIFKLVAQEYDLSRFVEWKAGKSKDCVKTSTQSRPGQLNRPREVGWCRDCALQQCSELWIWKYEDGFGGANSPIGWDWEFGGIRAIMKNSLNSLHSWVTCVDLSDLVGFDAVWLPHSVMLCQKTQGPAWSQNEQSI